MMSTQTQPAAPDPDEPTAIVANKATPLAELAWSDVEDDDDLFDTDDRSTTFWLWLYVGTTAARCREGRSHERVRVRR
jgi:hypothetical protein